MALNSEDVLNDKDNHQDQDSAKPNAWRVEDDDNLKEGNLERKLYGDSDKNTNPVKEGQGMGGQNFGQNNTTYAGNDKNNPSQYAGDTNAYFDRKEPSEEHPEDTNFKAADQDGAPDYDKAQAYAKSESPKPEKQEERGNGENDRPHEEEPYKEGTTDTEEVNIPGPNELPDQQKVGEDEEK